MIQRTVVSLAVVALCPAAEGDSISMTRRDLHRRAPDTKFILSTYPDSEFVLIDVRTQLDSATAGQYHGTRFGDASSGYDFELQCLNAETSAVCDEWGPKSTSTALGMTMARCSATTSSSGP